jgi:hypothetical protein
MIVLKSLDHAHADDDRICGGPWDGNSSGRSDRGRIDRIRLWSSRS